MLLNEEIAEKSHDLMSPSSNFPKSDDAPKEVSEELEFVNQIRDREVTGDYDVKILRVAIEKGDSTFNFREKVYFSFPSKYRYGRFKFDVNPRLKYVFDPKSQKFELVLCFFYQKKIHNQYKYDISSSDGYPTCRCMFSNFSDLDKFMEYIGVGFSQNGVKKIRETFFPGYEETGLEAEQIKFLYDKRPSSLRIVGFESVPYFKNTVIPGSRKTDEQRYEEIKILSKYDRTGTAWPLDGFWKDSEDYIPTILSTIQDTDAILKKWLKDPTDLIEFYDTIEDNPGGREAFVGLITAFCLKNLIGEGGGSEEDEKVKVPDKFDIVMRQGYLDENDYSEKVEEEGGLRLFGPRTETRTYVPTYSYELKTKLGFPFQTVLVDCYETESTLFEMVNPDAHGYGDPEIIRGSNEGEAKIVATTKIGTKEVDQPTYSMNPFAPATVKVERDIGVHPLTMIKFQNYDDKTNNILQVPAIYVKLLADRERRAEIARVVKIIGYVVQGVLTIYGFGLAVNAGTRLARLGWLLFEAANATDLVIDLVNPDPSDEALKTYIDNYHTFTLGLNVAVTVVALPQLLKYGARIVAKYSGQAVKLSREILEMCEAFLEQGVKRLDFPDLVKGSISRIKFNVAKTTGLNSRVVTKLETEGVIFTRASQITPGGTKPVFVAIYDGQVVARGTSKELKAALKPLSSKSGAALREGLDDLVGIKKIDEAIKSLGIETKLPVGKYSNEELVEKTRSIISKFQSHKRKFDPGKKALRDRGVVLPKTERGLSVDFRNSKYLYPAKGNQKNIVKIKLTGSDDLDVKLANKLAGFDKRKPKQYTWHHLDDFDPATGTCTMQLVETELHAASCPHLGGVGVARKLYPEANIYPNRY